MQLAQVDWGSVPDWLAGIGSILALTFAYFAVRAAFRANRFQAEQIRDAALDKHREQASQVAIWSPNGEISKTSSTENLILHSVNRSGLPVYGIQVAVFVMPFAFTEQKHNDQMRLIHDDPSGWALLEKRMPVPHPTVFCWSTVISVLPPTDEIVPVESEHFIIPKSLAEQSPEGFAASPLVAAFYLDTKSDPWIRDFNGRLIAVTGPVVDKLMDLLDLPDEPVTHLSADQLEALRWLGNPHAAHKGHPQAGAPPLAW
ncbi:hypothetical protein ACQP04_16990 [Pseudonocardia halophobica]|uniref:hypothetical protein n=1 Tax=Pseudonocardia halophobica TaxID=29401 RepID=UPI003D8D1679